MCSIHSPSMALPPSWKIMNMQRSLASSRGERGLDEPTTREVLGWLHEALVELERRGAR
jgi:hypothetical protein